jgi:hypothetical protein
MELLPSPLVAALVAVAGVAAWFGLLGLMAIATRSPSPRPGPPADPNRLDTESPAVVDLITGNWRLCEEAAAATVLDLAARRVVAIEEIGPELSLVRLGRGEPPTLSPYERMVFDHLRRLARDGVVATGALAEGTRNIGSWWKSFTHEVIEEARARGLSQRRWSPWHRTLLSAAALLPAVLVAVAFLRMPSEDGDSFFGSLGAGFVAYAALVALAEKMNGERGTALGAEVAGRWLGLRDHLAGGRFGEQPAAAVTIWGRPLAYAAALGLAPRAVASLPIASPADDRRAWSDHGGLWHVVDVRYGGLLRGRTVWSGLGAAAIVGFATFMVAFVVLLVFGAFLDVGPSDPIAAARWLALTVAAVVVVMAFCDLVSRPEVRGQVVRKRCYARRTSGEQPKYRYWIAIDEGTSRDIQALGIDEDRWHRLEEGDVVAARVGKRLGRIYDVQVVTPSRHRGGRAPTPPGAA